MTFQQLLNGAEVLSQTGNPAVSGVEYDSRRVHPGTVFVAMKGESSDLLRNHVNQSAVRDEQVQQSVVVEVLRAVSPTHILGVCLGDTGPLADVVEHIAAQIPVHAVVLGVGNEEPHLAVVLEIGEYRSHGGSVLAVLSECHAGLSGNLLEGPVL